MPVVKGLAEEARVLRGGSFNNNRKNARCAYRNNNDPNNFNDNNGFRVVVASHIFPGFPRNFRRHGLLERGRKDGRPASWLAATV